MHGENEEIGLYIGGVKHNLPINQSPLMVTSTGVSSDISVGMETVGNTIQMADSLLVQVDDDDGSVIISTGEGASVSLSLQMSFLRMSVDLPESFTNQTSGLLGKLNGIPEDDFQTRDGRVLQLSTEREIYEEFGLLCKYKW